MNNTGAYIDADDGARQCAAACGRLRHTGEVKKQGAMRSAPNEQCDYVFEEQNRKGSSSVKVYTTKTKNGH